MDKQYGFSIILILVGFGLLQMQGDDPFLIGAGIGTIVIGMFWLVLQIIRALRKSKVQK